jgi:hypothetical protein
MVLVSNSWRIWLAGMAASLIIFAVVYFAVIQPDQNTANQVLKSGLQQTQQVIKQAQKQIGSAGGQTGAVSASGQTGAVSRQVKQQLSAAGKLTACVAAAGTDPTKIQACQVKYAG